MTTASTEDSISPSDGISRRATQGTTWLLGLSLALKAAGLVRTVLLARFLNPVDFGLLGIASLVLHALQVVLDPGVGAALVQRSGDITEYLDTAWWLLLAKGVLSGLVLFTAAPLLSAFFRASDAVPVLQAMAAVPLLAGLTNVGTVSFTRQLNFRMQAVYAALGPSLDLVLSVGLAWMLRNVWALVIAILVGQIVTASASYLVHPFRPRLRFSKQRAKELLSFGRWIWGLGVINYLVSEGDDVVVGRVLGHDALGAYRYAYRLSNLPATEITDVVSRVAFPVYSRLQKSPDKLQKAYLSILQLLAFAVIPVSVLIIVFAADFTRLLLGPRWMVMVPALRILSVWGALRAIGASTGPVFQALGSPDVITKLASLRLALLAIFIYPSIRVGGIAGAAVAVVLVALLVNPLVYYLAVRLIRCSAGDFLRMVGPPLVGSGAMLVVLQLARCATSSPGMLVMFAQALGAGVSYLLVMLCLDDRWGLGLRANLRDRVHELLSKVILDQDQPCQR
jgi:O-antigen/teichoic acid export membrane protein